MINIYPSKFSKAILPPEDSDIYKKGDNVFLFSPTMFTDYGLSVAWERGLLLQEYIRERKADIGSEPALLSPLGEYIQDTPLALVAPRLFAEGGLNPLVQIAGYLSSLADEAEHRRMNFFRGSINHYRFQKPKVTKVIMSEIYGSYNRCPRPWLKEGTHVDIEPNRLFKMKYKRNK